MVDRKKIESTEEFKTLSAQGPVLLRYFEKLATPKERPILAAFALALVKCLEKGSVRQMKMMLSDNRELVRGLNPDQQREIDELLITETGSGLKKGQRLFEKQVAAIIKRNKIRNADEGRLLIARADEIYADEQKKDEMEAINSLLSAYEMGKS